MKPVSGTREWAEVSVNCVKGCSHNCRYCYARYNALNRYHQIETAEEWTTMAVNPKAVNKRHKRYDGVVMFPTTHDITPDVLSSCITVLLNLLSFENQVLLVTKPHLECVKTIIQETLHYKEHLKFRFTIGSDSDTDLSYWEPGAPSFEERRESLIYAFESGFQTSVSAEPLLNPWTVNGLIEKLIPYVTDSLWIGKMNSIDKRVEIKTPEDEVMVTALKLGQKDAMVREIYNDYKDHPKLRWKESYKKVVGLKLAEKAGLDI